MHDSSCGCPDCANFHPNRFANVGVPTASDRSAEERREFEEWANNERRGFPFPLEGMERKLAELAWRARGRLLEEENRDWSLTIERLSGEDFAVLREPGKMDTTTPILTRQLPWFNALRNLLGRKVGA